jgi:amino acid adenylation domain-containing protein
MTLPASDVLDSLVAPLEARGVLLWLEGRQLRFRAPPGALTAEEKSLLAAQRDAVIAALRAREEARTNDAPLSYGQRSLWLVHQEAPESAAYNVAFVVRVRSAVDTALLRDALQALSDRHPQLRSVYVVRDGRPLQRTVGALPVALEQHDCSELDDTALRARVQADYARPFDLQTGPVWRASLFTRRANEHVLLLTAHHIAVDGWSLLLLLDELRQRLAAGAAGVAPPALPRPEPGYADYTAWQAQMLSGPAGETLAAFWREQMAAPRSELELPTDRARPTRKSEHGATHRFDVPASLVARLEALARAEGTTLFVLLLAAFKVLLMRLSGTEDVIVGTPTLGRDKGRFDRCVGHFVNPVPVRTAVAADLPFRALLGSVRHTLLAALDAQEYPLALMVEQLAPQRHAGRSPFFETVFALLRFEQFGGLAALLNAGSESAPVDFGGLAVQPYPMAQQEGQFDLSLGLIDNAGGLEGGLKYARDLFEPAVVGHWARAYVTLLESITAAPASPVGALRLLGEAERRALVGPVEAVQVAPSGGADPSLATLHQRFEGHAAARPDAVALRFAGHSVSYRELNQRANRLAHALIAAGAGPGTCVGLCIERTPDLVVGLLGILKAGAGYVPLDLAYPTERVRFILDDAAAPLLVSHSSLRDRRPAFTGRVFETDGADLASFSAENPHPRAGEHDLIYIIYTSGSTGRPKGTLLTHQAVRRLMDATHDWYRFDANDRWTLFHSVAFDFSVWELWGALAYGGTLVIVPYLTSRAPHEFLALVRDEGVTVLNQTPSAFRQFIQADIASGAPQPLALRHVIFGGEALELQSLRPWFERHGDAQPRLVNMYGITETCVHVTYRPITLADLESGRGSVIGCPIPDLRVHVLDTECEPVPVGVVGEIYVGGPGLAQGYLNRPELTAQRFVPDPFMPGQRLYRTGDLARRLHDGDIEYIGRADSQVKVRGFRIELGEIEAALGRHAGVRQSVVVARDDASGTKQLVAYVVADADAARSAAALREHLRAQLPDYMVPAAFVFLDTLPLTGNNKVDTKALPEPATHAQPLSAAHDEPRTTLEFQLLALWRQALGNEALGVHDNFFDHGGHSLVAVELVSRIEQVFGRKLPLATLFQAPAVAQMAELLQRSDWQASWRSLVAINPGGDGVPMFLVPGVGGNVLMFGKLSKLLGSSQPLYGLQARGLDGSEEPFRSVPEMAEHYVGEILAARPAGPYFIGGTCTGGVIAFEVAQRLQERGATVQLALLETWPPATAKPRSWLSELLWPMRYLVLKLAGYLQEMRAMPAREWPAFLRRKWATGRAVLDVGLKETLVGSTYYVEKVVDATIQAVGEYEPRPYRGGLLNVIAINRPLPSQAVDTRRTWEDLASGPNHAVMIAAEDSGRLFVSPHVDQLAEVLRQHASGARPSRVIERTDSAPSAALVQSKA